MHTLARVIAFLSLLCGAEVAASRWVWARAPTDSIRVWYSGFWAFEAGRLHYWVPVFASLLALWIVGWYAFRRHGRLITWLFAAALGVGLEVATRSEEHTSELQSRPHLVCRLLLEKKNSHRGPGHARLGLARDRARLGRGHASR